MSSYFARLIGFSVPTVGFVLALHLQREHGWGEALDGLVSGVAITLPFAVAVTLRSRFSPARATAAGRGALHELAFGLLASLVAWCALWLLWSLPPMQPFREQALAINAATMALAGLVLPPIERRGGGLHALEADKITVAMS